MNSSREKRRRKNHFDLQTVIHEPESINISRPVDPKTEKLIRPAKEFDVHLESDNYSEEKYALYANYQHHVHKEGPSQITKSGFRRFLCSGLGQSSRLKDGVMQKLGSYHQCYRLEGRLVAMGVLDLLPGCVSSVYLIYHQDVKDWYFGKLSALREIALAVEGGYRFYYMGFYIHSCIKMRYKNQYQPSYLLDPETYTWDLLNADYLARLSLTDIDQLGLDNESYTLLRDYQQEFGPGGRSQSSALGSRMPGLMSLEEVEEKIDLGKWTLKFGSMLVLLEDLRGWANWEIHDPSSLKGAIAELAAALGPALVSQLVLDLG
ncbi:MAG: hypothetical protein L6R41_001878 [Letrouitia leprolyta]|nr:MAG: hypothetical protein L6R41_001878 [Letrouitia leprolyta]